MAEPDWRPLAPGDFAAAANFASLGDRLVDILTPRINFQRFNIGLIDLADYMFVDAYVSGQNVAGRSTGHRRTLGGTVVEAAIAAGEGVFVGGDAAALLMRFPRFGPVIESGMRAMLAAPLRHEASVVASLVLASADPDAFDQAALDVVNLVGAAAVGRIVDLRAGTG
jgi:hypothetical protein